MTPDPVVPAVEPIPDDVLDDFRRGTERGDWPQWTSAFRALLARLDAAERQLAAERTGRNIDADSFSAEIAGLTVERDALARRVDDQYAALRAAEARVLPEGVVTWKDEVWELERTSHADPWATGPGSRAGVDPKPTDWLYRLIPYRPEKEAPGE